MNREILFRAKKIDDGEWVEGYLFDDGLPKPKRFFIGGFGIYEYEGAPNQWAINRQDYSGGCTEKVGSRYEEGGGCRWSDWKKIM